MAAGTALIGGFGDEALRGVRTTKLTRGGSKKLGNLKKLKDADIAEAIIYRGGNASNVRKAVGNKLKGKTVGEVANLAAQGDKYAQTAVKILKQAAKKGQKY